MTELSAEAYAIVEGRHSDPFHYLGLHTEDGQTVVRAFLPEASKVDAIDEHGAMAELSRIHDAGLFAGALPNGSRRYRLRACFGDTVVNLDDPYRFPPVLSDLDLYLLGEGTHQRIYDKLGAHPMTLDDVPGVACVQPMRGGSAWSAISISGIRGGIRCGCAAPVIGSCSCLTPPPATTTSSMSSGHRASICR
jgi:1,4-alpha-glucan branching enzyme